MVEHVIRGVPLWLLADYVAELGGQANGSGWHTGNGWKVRLTQVEDYAIGSLRVGQVRLEIVGEAGPAARVWEALQPRLLRGGG